MSIIQLAAIIAVSVFALFILASIPDQHSKRIVRPDLDARPKRGNKK